MDNKDNEVQLPAEIAAYFRCFIYLEKRLVVLRLLQTASLKEIALWEAAMMHEPLFSPDMDGVVDQRVTPAELNCTDVKELAETNRSKHGVRGRWVHLVNDPMSTAMAIMYKRETGEQQQIEAYSSIKAISEFFGYDITPYLDV